MGIPAPPRPFRHNEDGTVSVELTKGYSALIDAADAPRITTRRWHAQIDGPRVYAIRNATAAKGKYYMLPMHRAVLGLAYGDATIVDHINGNPLDNRRCNLRLATCTQNAANSGRRSNKRTSRFKGVYKLPSGRWRAIIRVANVDLSLGCHATDVEAARAYNQAATEHYGQFARVNTINQLDIYLAELTRRNAHSKTSRFLGVYRLKHGKWRAKFRGQHVGCYETEIEAAKAYNAAANAAGESRLNEV